jgi:hypothetical protein
MIWKKIRDHLAVIVSILTIFAILFGCMDQIRQIYHIINDKNCQQDIEIAVLDQRIKCLEAKS